ncbi:MAG TPA: MBL fold metallo-hydrolase [Polyangiaceae bacterium]|nr:MBL fold metallo-hydrolase [Polyangiaceae bacterium]
MLFPFFAALALAGCSTTTGGGSGSGGASGGQPAQAGASGAPSMAGAGNGGAPGTGGAPASGGAPPIMGCDGGQTSGMGGADGSMTVTLLGTGSPIPSPDRFGPSTLVEAAGVRLVFDVGRGAPIRLWQKQIPLGSINAHFLTHLHSDHVNGLPDLWMSGWIQTAFGSRKTPFVLYGPDGTQAMMTSLWDAFSEDRRIRLDDEMNPIAGIEFDVHDVAPGLVYCQNGVAVSTFDVDHGDLVRPARGYKITYGARSVVLSGDTRYNTNVEQAATGADLLVHEVAMIPVALVDKYPAYAAILAHHITPEDAGKLFAIAQPKLAVYSHVVLSGLPSEGIPFPTPADVLTATKTTYSGPVIVGADQMAFRIDASGVTMVVAAAGSGGAGMGGAAGMGGLGGTGGLGGMGGPGGMSGAGGMSGTGSSGTGGVAGMSETAGSGGM